jgi:hypothetical protein
MNSGKFPRSPAAPSLPLGTSKCWSGNPAGNPDESAYGSSHLVVLRGIPEDGSLA